VLFVQHFNMLSDARLEAWRAAILEQVRPTDTVVDLGSGTGLFALLASEQARKVYAVEVDPHLARYAREVVARHERSHLIEVIRQDARRLVLPEQVDVIICEMLDTGLIKELQAQVLNHVVERWLRPGGRVVPQGARCLVEGIEKDFRFFGYDLPLPHFATSEVRPSGRVLTDTVEYLRLDFGGSNRLRVAARVRLTVREAGRLSALAIRTVTDLGRGRLLDGSHWLNPPLVLPIEPLEAQAGDTVEVSLSYRLGGGMKTLDYHAALR